MGVRGRARGLEGWWKQQGAASSPRSLHQAKLPANIPGTHRGSGAERSSDTQSNIALVPASEKKPLSLPNRAKASDSAMGTFLQVAIFHSFSLLSNIPLCVCVCVCVYLFIYINHIFFIHSAVSGHLGCFYVHEAILKNLNCGGVRAIWGLLLILKSEA